MLGEHLCVLLIQRYKTSKASDIIQKMYSLYKENGFKERQAKSIRKLSFSGN